MFWRYLDGNFQGADGHPTIERTNAIRDLYKSNDALLGEILDRLEPDDVLMAISDHGFSAFRRGVNLNVWLQREGYLTLDDNHDDAAEWLTGVDWSRTKAYCLGLAGMYLNIRGREERGIVQPGSEAESLKAEIADRLKGLIDPETGEISIREAFDTAELYDGPYLENAPDLLIGYNAGYRASWDAATGVVAGAVFTENVKAWSGDHCIDPRLVPGVFFCNRRVDVDEPSLIDIAPTALRLFGVAPPSYMEGRSLEVAMS